MPRLHYILVLFTFLLIMSCRTGDGGTTIPVREPDIPEAATSLANPIPPPSEGHVRSIQSLVIDIEIGTAEIQPSRTAETHYDLAWFWKYFPDMLSIAIVDIDAANFEVTLAITFKNPVGLPLGDVRAIFPNDGMLVPVTIDGWSIRGGAPVEDPDPYFGFGNEYPNHMIGANETSLREITFKYTPPLEQPPLTPFRVDFVLNAVRENNTAEPYHFGQPDLTGRLFHIALSDWQDDITEVRLETGPLHLTDPIRLAHFGDNGEYGGSIPDIQPGDYRLRVVAESPESPGEIGEGEPAVAVHWIDFHWPPEGPLVPLPRGQGIYGYSFIDPDTNLPPTDATAFMNKFRNDMAGDWLLIEYGEICNNGYLAVHSWTPIFIDWMHTAAPDLPIHIVLDNLGFQPIDQDPCHAPVENYTDTFFDHLLTSIQGQILDNPDFDDISGIHFDIEIFWQLYTEQELFEIYDRYADFLARLHFLPGFDGLNVTLYEFDHHPHKVEGDLSYLCTTDAFMGETYFSRFTWDWDPSEYETPFHRLLKIMGTYNTWSREYGRPYYIVPGTFSGWIDPELDTLGDFTLCPGHYMLMIDEYCFGMGEIGTNNEFDVVRARDVHGLEVEKTILYLDSGEPIFPANGFAVYNLGDGSPSTYDDDIVVCRTAYSMAKLHQTILDNSTPYSLGTAVFRYENYTDWKVGVVSQPLKRV